VTPATASELDADLEREVVRIEPQPGPQTAFLETTADVAIFGGAAGGGKTYGLLLECLRPFKIGAAGAVIFRRTYAQIAAEGGMWDDAGELYPQFGGDANQTEMSYTFDSGYSIKFSHLQHDKDRLQWKGAQIPIIAFDQLEDFTESQFWYLFSRNRSARAGFRPYIRATCNPVPETDKVGGWLAKLVAWWIDPETGYAIPDRAGAVRWFARVNEELVFADSREELVALHPKSLPKSLTFIPSKLQDNPALTAADPDYLANLEALPLVERERLLGGNWKIKPTAGAVFNRANFGSLPAMPTDVPRWVRYWDKAGTAGGGKYSAGVLVGQRPNGRLVYADVTRDQWSSYARNKVMLQKAAADKDLGVPVTTWVEQEPGSGGKESAEISVQDFVGYDVRIDKVTGSKYDRAQPLAAQVEAGNVDVVAGPWNEAFLEEHHQFTGTDSDAYTDQVDAAAGGVNKLKLEKPRRKGGALW